jgi:hypothetical protein
MRKLIKIKSTKRLKSYRRLSSPSSRKRFTEVTDFETILVADRSALIRDVLLELGYEVWKTPIQIPCPVHKMGQEQKPSARVYSQEDHTLWCFYCNKHYSPTEIWEAVRGVSRGDAARSILGRWPVTDERARELVSEAGVVRRAGPGGPQGEYGEILERHLRNFRGKAKFLLYRKWALEVDEFSLYIETLSEESRESALQSFLLRLERDLVDK